MFSLATPTPHELDDDVRAVLERAGYTFQEMQELMVIAMMAKAMWEAGAIESGWSE